MNRSLVSLFLLLAAPGCTLSTSQITLNDELVTEDIVTDAEQLTQLLNAMNSELVALRSEVASARASEATLAARLESMDAATALKASGADLEELEMRVSTLEVDGGALAGDVTDLESRVDAVDATLDS